MLVPSPAFRSVALGIMIAVLFVLAATLTLLPAVLAKLGPRVDRLALPWAHSGEHRSPRFARWGELLWRRPLLFGGLGAGRAARRWRCRSLGLQTGMPSIKVVPDGRPLAGRLRTDERRLRPGRARARCRSIAPRARPSAVAAQLEADPGIAADAAAAGRARRRRADRGDARPAAPPTRPSARRSTGCAPSCPPAALVGGPAAENHDLEAALAAKTPLVIGVVLGLGFLLLLVAFQAPLIAALGVLANLLSTAAAFGVAKLIFQDGNLTGLLGFESQGFLDAWGPVFFFAMIFAIAMDYTVFLLSSAREHWERTGDAREAMVGGLAHSGRVILAAGAVMVAVFFTFALSGPLPPKEMGVDPRRRRPARRLPRPPAAAAGLPAPRGPGLVAAALARPAAAGVRFGHGEGRTDRSRSRLPSTKMEMARSSKWLTQVAERNRFPIFSE